MALNSKALVFSSSLKDRIDINPSVDFRNLGSFTFEAWVKVGANATNAEQRAWMIRQGGTQKRIRFAFAPIKGAVVFELARADGSSDTNYTYRTTWDDRWHHAAFIVNGPQETYSIVYDGAEVQTGRLIGFGKDAEDKDLLISDTASQGVYAGASTVNGTTFTYWDGKLDCVRLWNKALSANQIVDRMRDLIQDVNAADGLMGEWRLEPSGGSTQTAAKPTAQTGTWTGTIRRNGAAFAGTWDNDRPFLGEGKQDTTPPSQPSSLSTSSITENSFVASWGTATDDVYVQYYEITVALTNTFSEPVTGWSAKPMGLAQSVTVTNLDPATNYYVRVRAVDSNSNASTFRQTTTPTTTKPSGDLTPPTRPTLSAATGITATTFTLSWSASTDASGVAGYKLDIAFDPLFEKFVQSYRNRDVGNVRTLLVNEDIPPSTTLYARVRAYDAAENESENAPAVRIVTLPLPDIERPSTVEPIEATAIDAERFVARWLPATDNVGVVGYRLDVSQWADFAVCIDGYDNKNVGNVLQAVVAPVEERSTYYYRVRAVDAAGNVSFDNEQVTVVETLAKSATETGFETIAVQAENSLAVRVNNTDLSLGTVVVEPRSVRRVGRMFDGYGPQAAAFFPLNDPDSAACLNHAQSLSGVMPEHAQYRGPILFGETGPSKPLFGADARAVRFQKRGDEVGHIVLPTSIPNLTQDAITGDGRVNNVSFWFNVAAYGAGATFVEFAGDVHGRDALRLFLDNTGRLGLAAHNGLTEVIAFTASTVVARNVWHSFMYQRVRVTGSTTRWLDKFFLDGVEILSRETTVALPHKYRPVRHIGRSVLPQTEGQFFDGWMAMVQFASLATTDGYTSYTAIENSEPVGYQYAAVYRFPIIDEYGKIETYSLRLPNYNGTRQEVCIQRLGADDWGPAFFDRTTLDTRQSEVVRVRSNDASGHDLEVDVTSLVLSDPDDHISFLITADTSQADGLILGTHDDTFGRAPQLITEVDPTAAIEPRTLLVTPNAVDVVNLLKNPSAEAGVDGSTGIGRAVSGGTLTSETAAANVYHGTKSAKFVSSGTVATEGIVFLSPTALNLTGVRAFTGSFMLKATSPVPLGNVYIRVSYTDATFTQVPVTINATTAWQRVDLPLTVSNGKTIDSVNLHVRHLATATFTIWVDAAIVADVTALADRSPVPYFDGFSLGATWTGTAHASTSRVRATEIALLGSYVGDSNENATAYVEFRRSDQWEWSRSPRPVTFNRQTREVTGTVPALLRDWNMAANGSFESEGVGYSATGGLVTSTVHDDPYHGDRALRVTSPEGTTNAALTLNLAPPPAGTRYVAGTIPVRMRSAEPITLKTTITLTNGSVMTMEQAVAEPTNDWVAYDLPTFPFGGSAPVDIASVTLQVLVTTPLADFDLDGVAVQYAPVPAQAPRYAYGDATLVDGWWQGKPYESGSARRVLPDTDYHVRLVFADTDGVVNTDILGETIRTPAAPDTILTVGEMTLTGGPTHINVVLTYTGDDDRTATVLLQWRRSDQGAWQNLTPSWNKTDKTIYATIPNLAQGTSYDVQAIFADGTAPIYGENPILRQRITTVETLAALREPLITFGGFTLLGPNEANIAVTEHDAFSAPERDIQFQALARVDGEVEQYDIWRRKTVSMSGYISAESRQELAEQLAAFRRAMGGRRQQLVIDTLDSRSFYNLATVSKLTIQETGGETYRHLPWSAEFVCADPFRYDTTETVEDSGPMADGDTLLIANVGDVQCDATYTITMYDTTPIQITLMNRTSGVRITPQTTVRKGDRIQIDTTRMRVLRNGVDVDFAGGFPRLVNGSNELAVLLAPSKATSGTPYKIKLNVRRRHRYL